ncbi:hypothetical protein OIV83_003702 [Microbotryomycetes sp. JL201]|nr:hypothetical protein OIV83_003702 [Microbotryomycetes sp. JL201]
MDQLSHESNAVTGHVQHTGDRDDLAAGDTQAAAQPTACTAEPTNAKVAIWSLAAQHLAASWDIRTYEFAAYLFLIVLFPDTLVPASIFGFATTGVAICLSGPVGRLVDTSPRLAFVRRCIIVQKLTVLSAYSLFLVLFLRLRSDGISAKAWSIFACIVALSAVLNLSNVAYSVSIERDWITSIAQGDSVTLTTLNAWLRRIDLVTKLVAPLVMSALSAGVSYPFSIAFMLGYSVASFAFQMWCGLDTLFWIAIVWQRCPVLGIDEKNRLAARQAARTARQQQLSSLTLGQRAKARLNGIKAAASQLFVDWHDFARHEVFPTSVAISLLYLTVLSFDGTMISWLKSHGYSDPFIAGMRGVNVVTGLLGTVAMPWLEKRIGIARTGTWSIISEAVSLIPVLLSFFLSPPPRGQTAAGWNEALLFTGMAMSRIGLWAFDLCQLKLLQTLLEQHPRRNALTALQFSLQNMMDLLKSVLSNMKLSTI